MTLAQALVAAICKTATSFNRQHITVSEFINSVFAKFSSTEIVYPEAIPEIWAAIPEGVRGEFVAAIRDALRPDYRHRAFWIGGGEVPDEWYRQESELRTARVRAWAEEFIRYLASIGVADR